MRGRITCIGKEQTRKFCGRLTSLSKTLNAIPSKGSENQNLLNTIFRDIGRVALPSTTGLCTESWGMALISKYKLFSVGTTIDTKAAQNNAGGC
jgi:hypothetical protein